MAGQDLIIERAFYQDQSASLSFEQVQQKPFIPFNDALNQGYSKAAFWVRIRIDRVTDGGTIVIKILPNYLDEIALFALGSLRPRQVVGDRYPLANNGVRALGYNFIVDPAADGPYYWLRLKTTSTSLMAIEAIPYEKMAASSATEYMLSGMLLGVLCVFGLMGAAYFLASREVINGAFFLKQLLALMLALFFLGHVRLMTAEHWSPSTIDTLTSYCIFIYTFSAGFFYTLFFKEYKTRAWAGWLMVLSLLLIAMATGLFAVGYRGLALGINMGVMTFVSCLLVLISIFGIRWHSLQNPVISRPLLITIQSANFLSAMFTSLPSLGLMTGTQFTTYAAMLTAIVSSIFMLLIVRFRAKKQDQQRLAEIAVQVNRAEQEKQQRERQEKFMAMLTHELKTPLAVIRFAARNALGKSHSSARIERAVDDINAVIDRCQQADKLEKGWVLSKKKHSVRSLVEGCLDRLEQKDRIHISVIPNRALSTDSALFGIILSNLLENALKYSPSGDRVDLNIIVYDGTSQLCLTVKNRIGKAGAPDKEKVFKKYYRSELAHAITGSGLGLFIVQALTQLLDGQADYQYEGEQVTFSVTLPL